MDEMRQHPWVTENGESPLITKDENCYDLVELSDSDISSAIKPVANIFTVIKAVSKLKKIGKSGLSIDRSNDESKETIQSSVDTSVRSSVNKP